MRESLTGIASPHYSSSRVRERLLIAAIVAFVSIFIANVVFWQKAQIEVEFIEFSTTKTVDGTETGQGDEAWFQVVFDITATESDIYIPTKEGVGYKVSSGGLGLTSTSHVDMTGPTDESGKFFIVEKGSTERLTFTVIAVGVSGMADFVSVELGSIAWTTDTKQATKSYTNDLEQAEPNTILLRPQR